jgi:uncharacterized protein YacL
LFKHSLFYRLLSNSFILGWLFSCPEEEEADFITSSYAYRLSHWVVEAILKILYKIGCWVQRMAVGSVVGKHMSLIVGTLVFLYFSVDIAINHYELRRSLIEMAIALIGLSMAMYLRFPGLWQGSLLLSFFRWWAKTD